MQGEKIHPKMAPKRNQIILKMAVGSCGIILNLIVRRNWQEV
jgi:hypothetical protein